MSFGSPDRKFLNNALVALQKTKVWCLCRLYKGSYKAVSPSVRILCATRSDRDITFKSFSSPCQRFFNSAIACYSLL